MEYISCFNNLSLDSIQELLQLWDFNFRFWKTRFPMVLTVCSCVLYFVICLDVVATTVFSTNALLLRLTNFYFVVFWKQAKRHATPICKECTLGRTWNFPEVYIYMYCIPRDVIPELICHRFWLGVVLTLVRVNARCPLRASQSRTLNAMLTW